MFNKRNVPIPSVWPAPTYDWMMKDTRTKPGEISRYQYYERPIRQVVFAATRHRPEVSNDREAIANIVLTELPTLWERYCKEPKRSDVNKPRCFSGYLYGTIWRTIEDFSRTAARRYRIEARGGSVEDLEIPAHDLDVNSTEDGYIEPPSDLLDTMRNINRRILIGKARELLHGYLLSTRGHDPLERGMKAFIAWVMEGTDYGSYAQKETNVSARQLRKNIRESTQTFGNYLKAKYNDVDWNTIIAPLNGVTIPDELRQIGKRSVLDYLLEGAPNPSEEKRIKVLLLLTELVKEDDLASDDPASSPIPI